MKRSDIASQAVKVGDALTSVRLDEMICTLAKGIAWGQYDLDKVGMDITKMMGVPGTANVGGEKLSMLEAGFLPSFYHFVETILELKMEINIREEEAEAQKTSATKSYSRMSERSSSRTSSRSARIGGGFFGGGSVGGSSSSTSSSKTRVKSAYSRTVDTAHAQKYSQELNATSLMRTKLVPKPAPEVLVERIRLMLERLKAEAEAETSGKPEDVFDAMMEKMEKQFMEDMVSGIG